LRGVYKPMELVMRGVAQRQFGTQLRTVKILLESEGPLHYITSTSGCCPSAAEKRTFKAS